MSVPLDRSGMGTFDSSGRAVVRLAPERAGECWIVRRVSVSTTSSSRTTATTYKSFEQPSRKLDRTVKGNDATSEDDSYKIDSGESFLCIWEGGTTGAVATLYLIGTVENG